LSRGLSYRPGLYQSQNRRPGINEQPLETARRADLQAGSQDAIGSSREKRPLGLTRTTVRVLARRLRRLLGSLRQIPRAIAVRG
jgi:hypothetical protein